MKIFNWVHRKFHHKDGVDENVKKAAELVTKETETQVLLEHVTIDNILTIGTFGFDPLTQFNKQTEFLEFEKEEKQELDNGLDYENEIIEMHDCDEEEVLPLVFNSIGSGFDENALKNYEIGFEFNDSEGEKAKKKEVRERITLADLLKDDDYQVKTEQDSYCKKPDDVHAKKKGFLFSQKKLIPSVGDDTPTIKKLHKLMRRMMKRKIHPVLEDQKIQEIKSNAQIKPTTTTTTAIGGLQADEYGALELVSLLQSKDPIIRG